MKKTLFAAFLIFLLSTGSVSAAMINSNLSLGSKGSEVVTLQTYLIQQNLLTTETGAATGYFGNQTFEAVKVYQRSNNIEATGFVGPLTRVAINKVIQNQYSDPATTAITVLPDSFKLTDPIAAAAGLSSTEPVIVNGNIPVQILVIDTVLYQWKDGLFVKIAQGADVSSAIQKFSGINWAQIEGRSTLNKVFIGSTAVIASTLTGAVIGSAIVSVPAAVVTSGLVGVGITSATSGISSTVLAGSSFGPVGAGIGLAVGGAIVAIKLILNKGQDKVRDTKKIEAAYPYFNDIMKQYWSVTPRSQEEAVALHDSARQTIQGIFDSITFEKASSRIDQQNWLQKNFYNSLTENLANWQKSFQDSYGALTVIKQTDGTLLSSVGVWGQVRIDVNGKVLSWENSTDIPPPPSVIEAILSRAPLSTAPFITGIQGWWLNEGHGSIASNATLVLYGKFPGSGNIVTVKDSSITKEYPATVLPGSGLVNYDQINVQLGTLYGNKVTATVKNNVGISNEMSIPVIVLPTGLSTSISNSVPPAPTSVQGTLAVKPVIAAVQGYDTSLANPVTTTLVSNKSAVLYGTFAPSGNSVMINSVPTKVTYENTNQINVQLGTFYTEVATIVVSNGGGESPPYAIGVTLPIVPPRLPASSDITPSITGVQGFDAVTGSYTTNTVGVGKTLVLYGTFPASGNKVTVGTATYEPWYQSTTQMNVSIPSDISTITKTVSVLVVTSSNKTSNISSLTLTVPAAVANPTCSGTAPACTPLNSCGKSNTGVKVCTNGVWTGCSVVAPAESTCTVVPPPPAPAQTAVGKCGTGTSNSSTGAPTSDLCVVGISSSVNLDTVAKAYTWSCSNGTPTSLVSCSKPYAGTINGVCGNTQNTEAPYTPQLGYDALCYTGSASNLARNSDGTYSWKCNGSAASTGVNAGSSVVCINKKSGGVYGTDTNQTTVPATPAPAAATNGVCGGATYVWSPQVPSNNYCSAGSVAGFAPNGDGTYGWTCVGTGTGATTATCANIKGYSSQVSTSNQLANAITALQALLKQITGN